MVCLLPLVHYIPLDYIRSCPVAHRSDIIAVTPKFTAPQSFFHLGKLLKYLPAGNALQNIHNLRGWKPWRSGNKNMNVVAVGAQRDYRKTIPFSNFPNDLVYCIADCHIHQNIVPVFYNPNNVILYYIPRMCGYGITWHMPRLYHNTLTRAGGYPPANPLNMFPAANGRGKWLIYNIFL